MTLVALPVTPLLFLLVAQLQLSVWVLLAGSTIYPYLVMGIVERHIRKEIRRRPLAVGTMPVPISSSEPSGRALPATLAALSLIMATLAVFNVGKAVTLVAVVVGVAALLVTAVIPRTRRVANQLDRSEREATPRLPPGADRE
ncbi:hypothetical protein [Nannocystis pusilla]|uniref:hypothetical protein n=1 Tax=Nannocystis pusilla TaxID=889268 RepID=UPI003BF195E2